MKWGWNKPIITEIPGLIIWTAMTSWCLRHQSTKYAVYNIPKILTLKPKHSMDCFKETKMTGNHGCCHQISGFPMVSCKCSTNPMKPWPLLGLEVGYHPQFQLGTSPSLRLMVIPCDGNPNTISHRLPSGKHTKNYGQSPFLIGKSTISMAIFNSKLFVYQRVTLKFTESTVYYWP